jgi:hypothetical protein
VSIFTETRTRWKQQSVYNTILDSVEVAKLRDHLAGWIEDSDLVLLVAQIQMLSSGSMAMPSGASMPVMKIDAWPAAPPASTGTIRLKLFKIGALVRISVRRIKIAMASGCPVAKVWGLAATRLAAAARASPA